MATNRVIEGTGEEIASFAKKHPRSRFKLIVLEEENVQPKYGGPSPEVHEQTMQFRESLRGKFPVADPTVFSTEELYD